MSSLEYKLFYRRHLPHIQPPGATLFVTFRLVGSLPQEASERLRQEAERFDAELKPMADAEERRRKAYIGQKKLFELWDAVLDNSQSGHAWLQDPRVADLIADSMHHRDGRVYDLIAFCIMSNHVHAVFTPLEIGDGSFYSLSAIMHSLKLYTAREANLLLNRKGPFWQSESYDRVVRNDKELERIVQYILNNPVKAGLVEIWQDWRWVYCKYPL